MLVSPSKKKTETLCSGNIKVFGGSGRAGWKEILWIATFLIKVNLFFLRKYFLATYGAQLCQRAKYENNSN